MSKAIISEKEYDSLSDISQSAYEYCAVCDVYYLKKFASEHHYHNEPYYMSEYKFIHSPASLQKSYRKCSNCGDYVRKDIRTCLCGLMGVK